MFNLIRTGERGLGGAAGGFSWINFDEEIIRGLLAKIMEFKEITSGLK